MADTTKQDRKSSYDELWHLYDKAESERTLRKTHKEMGWDEYDRLYRSNIIKDKWPFSSRIAVPTAFTALLKKDTRLIATKPTGKLVPEEDGQELGALIGTELLHSQWSDIDHYDDEPMLMRIFRWSQMARKYGDGYMWVPWKKERGFNGPTAIPWARQDVLTLSGSTSVQEGVFLLSYPTIQSLYDMNDGAASGPIYNPDVLKKIEAMGPSTNDQYSVNRDLKGLGTRLSDSNVSVQGKHRRVMIAMYRSPKRWIDFMPNRGGERPEDRMMVLRDIPNPYKHGRVPLVPLNYYPIDDDIAGVSELEAPRSMMKALNALVCNYMDSVNIELFPIMKAHPTNVNHNTIDYHARAVWIMQNPQTDVVRMEHSSTGLNKFIETYKMLIGAINEALGESSGDASSADAFAADKTATEIKDTALLRSARDNFNKLALSTAVAKIVYYWWEMDKQFLTTDKIIRVAGKEAIEYFVKEGLAGYELSDEGYQLIEQYMEANPGVDFALAYEALRESGQLEEYAKPTVGVKQQGQQLPKLRLDRSGKTGFLTVSANDLLGKFRYLPEMDSMSLPDDNAQAQNLFALFDRIVQSQEALTQEGDAPRFKDLLVQIAGKLKVNDAERFFGAGEDKADTSAAPGGTAQPDQTAGAAPQGPQSKISESINYKDAPDDIKRQMEQAAGFQPSQMASMMQQPGQMTAANLSPASMEQPQPM